MDRYTFGFGTLHEHIQCISHFENYEKEQTVEIVWKLRMVK